jgi:hypothetical protein
VLGITKIVGTFTAVYCHYTSGGTPLPIKRRVVLHVCFNRLQKGGAACLGALF